MCGQFCSFLHKRRVPLPRYPYKNQIKSVYKRRVPLPRYPYKSQIKSVYKRRVPLPRYPYKQSNQISLFIYLSPAGIVVCFI